ncbi:P-loop NTPase fold protein [Nonomuraea sp. CA-141351]|uniref:KAP family P-loop NTPase fold protein n=1 Tax=Nonomuraea sp. CA-141351 TaxID=3239996 RepID=UPI003D8F3A91
MEQSWGRYADQPIIEDHQDVLGYKAFADRVTGVLEAVAGPESVVLAVVGPWGSGKTSLLNLVHARLGRRKWRSAWFNPWALPDDASLIQAFFETIASTLPKGSAGRRVRKALMRYAAKVSPLLKLIPVGGEAAAGIAETMGKFAGSETVEARGKEVAERLREVGAPTLIVIDDVDRLHPEELTALFKAVRLLGRLPGICYLLAFDAVTIQDTLARTAIANGDASRARVYLEKIVQYQLWIPPIVPERLATLLITEMERMFAGLGAEFTPEQRERLRWAWDTVLRMVLDQPRAVYRYVARVAVYLPLVGPNEVDVVDFALLVFLQHHFVVLYWSLASSRDPDLFWLNPLSPAQEWAERDQRFQAKFEGSKPTTSLRPFSLPWGSEPGIGWRQTLAKADVPKRVADGLADIVNDLFPQHASPRLRGVGDPDYFHRYFLMRIPDSDLADSAVDRVVADLTAGRATEELAGVTGMLTGASADRILRKLRRCFAGLTGQAAYNAYRYVVEHAAESDDHPAGALRAWQTDLLLRSYGGPSPEEVVRDAVGEDVALVWDDPACDRLLTHLQASTDDPPSQEWLASLREAFTERMLSMAEPAVRRGDREDVPVAQMLDIGLTWAGRTVMRWVRESFHARRLNAAQLAGALSARHEHPRLTQIAAIRGHSVVARLAEALLEQGHQEEAVAILRAGVEDHDHAAAEDLAVLLATQDQVAEAIDVLRSLTSGSTAVEETVRQLARALSGWDRLDVAIRLLRDHIDDPLSASQLASMLKKQGRVQEAVDALRPHVEAGNFFLRQAVDLLMEHGPLEEAVELLRPLAADGHPRASEWLTSALHERDRTRALIADLEEREGLYPQVDDQLRELRKRLTGGE